MNKSLIFYAQACKWLTVRRDHPISTSLYKPEGAHGRLWLAAILSKETCVTMKGPGQVLRHVHPDPMSCEARLRVPTNFIYFIILTVPEYFSIQRKIIPDLFFP